MPTPDTSTPSKLPVSLQPFEQVVAENPIDIFRFSEFSLGLAKSETKDTGPGDNDLICRITSIDPMNNSISGLILTERIVANQDGDFKGKIGYRIETHFLTSGPIIFVTLLHRQMPYSMEIGSAGYYYTYETVPVATYSNGKWEKGGNIHSNENFKHFSDYINALMVREKEGEV